MILCPQTCFQCFAAINYLDFAWNSDITVGFKLHWCGLSGHCTFGAFVQGCCVCVSGRISGPPAFLFCSFKITLKWYSYSSNKVVTYVSDWQTSACVSFYWKLHWNGKFSLALYDFWIKWESCFVSSDLLLLVLQGLGRRRTVYNQNILPVFSPCPTESLSFNDSPFKAVVVSVMWSDSKDFSFSFVKP